MTSKSNHVSMRVDAKLKAEAEAILHEMGITPSQAVKMLYARVIQEQGWPCELKMPNKLTRKTLEETDKGENLTTHKSVRDIFEELEKEVEKDCKIARR